METSIKQSLDNDLRLPLEVIGTIVFFLPYDERVFFCSRFPHFFRLFKPVQHSYMVITSNKESTQLPEVLKRRFESLDISYIEIDPTYYEQTPSLQEKLVEITERLIGLQRANSKHKVTLQLAHDIYDPSCYHTANIYPLIYQSLQGLKHDVEILKLNIPVTDLTKSKDKMIGLFDYIQGVRFGYDSKLSTLEIHADELLNSVSQPERDSALTRRDSHMLRMSLDERLEYFNDDRAYHATGFTRSSMLFEDVHDQCIKRQILSLQNTDLNSFSVVSVGVDNSFYCNADTSLSYKEKLTTGRSLEQLLSDQNSVIETEHKHLTNIFIRDELQVISYFFNTVAKSQLEHVELPYIAHLLHNYSKDPNLQNQFTKLLDRTTIGFNHGHPFNLRVSEQYSTVFHLFNRGYYGIEKCFIEGFETNEQLNTILKMKKKTNYKPYLGLYEAMWKLEKFYQNKGLKEDGKPLRTNSVKVTLIHSFNELKPEQFQLYSMESHTRLRLLAAKSSEAYNDPRIKNMYQ